MSEPKFSPGPWKACKDSACSCKQIWSIPGDFPVCSADGFHVGVVHEHMADAPDLIYQSVWEETRNANAALITAAPDLYAALSEIVVAAEMGGYGSPALDDAKSALAKARGEITN